MAVTIEQYNALKADAEKLQRVADRAAGALDEQMKKLADFDCETIDEAKDKLEDLNKAASKAEGEFETALTEFEEEWGDTLANLPEED